MNPKYKPWLKLLGIMSIIAVGTTLGAVGFGDDDYRGAIFFVASFLVVVGIVIAGWFLCRNKTVVTVILASALALQPVQAGEEPDLVGALIVGGAILAVGGLIVWGLWKISKKLPDPSKHKNPPPATNGEPVSIAMVLDQPLSGLPPLIMPEASITEYNDWDNTVIQFQSSTNMQDWRAEYTATNWLNNSMMVSILYSNTVPLMTNFANMFWTNETAVSDFSSVMPKTTDEPLKLWRGVQLQ